MTTFICLHVKDEKEHLNGTRLEIKFWNKMCHQYLYGKIMVHGPKFIKKGKQL